ncbi:dolichyl-phosphate-mannose--protein mannosyltransferase [Dictyobacter alpinus]|uniref:Dolichyl-phosphate-mannose--protein mannosyltransferase n=1 Tax=Dictyobacter alpinus TaxID=2014873 RepID=A0A402B5Z3_9CHLR|nr:glycosyltransferase family 39 protein [Dictyobacter alpinus]GCE26750.1 dolichyl-phosphate-mannose--protein mannosyltransferase [Dictyobacter alpinus]
MQTDDVSTVTNPALPDKQSETQTIAESQPTQRWQRITLAVIVAFSAFLNVFLIQQNGYGNAYYTAAVKSMLMSWHNFFFVSFDPGGFVTVDKPPLGLWIQALSAKIFELLGFGFTGISVLLPQAIAGTLSVYIIYCLVRRGFGPVPGLIAALALALTPIAVVMNRDNNLDSLLVLTLLLATWCLLLAVDTGKLRWLLLCALLVGLGFNIKTLEAYLVVPAFGLFYLLSTRHGWGKRMIHLLIALALLLVVSFAWIVAVDMVPASQRPYVGSSQTNSELELTFGYNGLQRITGMGSGNRAPGTSSQTGSSATPAFGAGMMNEGGDPSALRLLKADLGGQVSWLLPLAVLGLIAMAWQARLRLPLNRWHQAVVLWGVWFLTAATFFSVAGFFHSYYLVIIAPALCALVGIGLVTLWNDYRKRDRGDWRTWALPVALLLTVAEQVYLLSVYGSPWSTILTPVVAVLSALGIVALIISKMQVKITARTMRLQRPAVIVSVVGLMLTPLIWSAMALAMPSNSVLPTAGPMLVNGDGGMSAMIKELQSANGTAVPGGGAGLPGAGFPGGGLPGAGTGTPRGSAGFPGGSGGMGNFLGGEKADTRTIQFLQANKGNARYLVAVQSAMAGEQLIIATGEPVMALGGFVGSDPILTLQQLQQKVASGEVRYFMFPAATSNDTFKNLPASIKEMIEKMGGGNPGNMAAGMAGSNGKIISWVQSSCKVVPTDQWKTNTQQSDNAQGGIPGGGMGMNNQLYDCKAA